MIAAERVAAYRQALTFMKVNSLQPVGPIQMTGVNDRAEVDRLMALGFLPDRYNHDEDGHGSLKMQFDGFCLYAGCNGPLLDYAESKVVAQ